MGLEYMKSKYIKFVKTVKPPHRKTNIYAIVSKSDKSLLGMIKWYPWWRQFVFFPEEGCVFNPSCMRDIISFIEDLMEKRKQKRAKKK